MYCAYICKYVHVCISIYRHTQILCVCVWKFPRVAQHGATHKDWSWVSRLGQCLQSLWLVGAWPLTLAVGRNPLLQVAALFLMADCLAGMSAGAHSSPDPCHRVEIIQQEFLQVFFWPSPLGFASSKQTHRTPAVWTAHSTLEHGGSQRTVTIGMFQYLGLISVTHHSRLQKRHGWCGVYHDWVTSSERHVIAA